MEDATVPSSPSAPATKSARKARKDEAREGIDASMIVPADSLAALAFKAGYLNKRSEQGIIHNWKKRWVVLHNNLLYYYESPESKKPQGIIQLDGATVLLKIAQKLKAKPECIMITTRSERVFYFAGPSTYDNSLWMEAIRSVPGVLSVTPTGLGGLTSPPVNAAAEEEEDATGTSSQEEGESDLHTSLHSFIQLTADDITGQLVALQGVTDAGTVLVLPPPPGLTPLEKPWMPLQIAGQTAEPPVPSSDTLPSSSDALVCDRTTSTTLAVAGRFDPSVLKDIGLTEEMVAALSAVGGKAGEALTAVTGMLKDMKSAAVDTTSRASSISEWGVHLQSAQQGVAQLEVLALALVQVAAAVAEAGADSIQLSNVLRTLQAVLNEYFGAVARKTNDAVISAVKTERKRYSVLRDSFQQLGALDISDEIEKAVNTVQVAEAAKKLALIEEIQEAAMEQAAEVASAELERAVMQVRIAKDAEIAALKAVLAEVTHDPSWKSMRTGGGVLSYQELYDSDNEGEDGNKSGAPRLLARPSAGAGTNQ